MLYSIIPPILPWSSIHPQIIHFPIALLLVTPVLLILGLCVPKHGRCFSFAALAVMFLGTVGAYVAVASGQAGAQLVERTPAISARLELHGDLGEDTRLIFSILTGLFAALLFVPPLLKKALSQRVLLVLQIVFLLLYGSATLVLANTAHQGGLLVHGLGVRALIPPQDLGPVSESPEGESP